MRIARDPRAVLGNPIPVAPCLSGRRREFNRFPAPWTPQPAPGKRWIVTSNSVTPEIEGK